MKSFIKHINSESVYENDTDQYTKEKVSESRLDLNTLLARMKEQQKIDKKKNIFYFLGVASVCLTLGILVFIY